MDSDSTILWDVDELHTQEWAAAMLGPLARQRAGGR